MSIHIKKIIAVLGFTCLLITPTIAQSPKPVAPRVLSVKETISYYAEKYGADETQLLGVAFCESSYRPSAVGDGGYAKNIYQYHKPTFDLLSNMMGETLDYNSYSDQAKLTAWVWVNKPEYRSHWTCFTKLYA